MRQRRTDVEVEQFEYVKASESSALLRLTAHWSGAAPPDQPVLVATARGHRTEVEELPSSGPATAGEPWRAAYSAAIELVEGGGVRFALELASGRKLRLPLPIERGTEPAASAPAPGPAARWRMARAERALATARSRATHGRDGLRPDPPRSAERGSLEAAVRSLEHDRSELERELEEARTAALAMQRAERSLRDQLREARAALARAQPAGGSRDVAAVDADRRLAALRERLENVTKARSEASAAVELAAALERELSAARESEQAAREHVAELDATLQVVRREVEEERERGHRVERELGAARGEAKALRASATETEELVNAARAGIDEGLRRLVALEDDADALRGALAETAERESPSGRRRLAHDAQALRSLVEERSAALAAIEREAEALRDELRMRIVRATEHAVVEPAPQTL